MGFMKDGPKMSEFIDTVAKSRAEVLLVAARVVATATGAGMNTVSGSGRKAAAVGVGEGLSFTHGDEAA